jgi:hypothetical protein
MKIGRLSTLKVPLFVAVTAVLGAGWSAGAFAADDDDRALIAQIHAAMQEHHAPTHKGGQTNNALVKIVRDTTRRYRDVSQAIADGYQLQFGCVTGSHEGAMGLHYVNFDLVGDPSLDAAHPELLVYEPLPYGKVRLVAVDYLVFKDAWDAANTATPQLMGQLFHLFDAPNRYGLPAFYTLHVWAWKDNPSGTFANWNPKVSCDAFDDTSM